ncbi:hypothetical protein ACT8ZS_15010 [Paenibacillus sp. M.A.Huq-84]
MTITNANMARGRFTVLGSVSFFKIRIRAKQNDTIIIVNIEAELLMQDSPHLAGYGLYRYCFLNDSLHEGSNPFSTGFGLRFLFLSSIRSEVMMHSLFNRYYIKKLHLCRIPSTIT